MNEIDNMKLSEKICQYTCILEDAQEILSSNIPNSERERVSNYKDIIEEIIEYLKGCDSYIVIDQLPPDFNCEKIANMKISNVVVSNIAFVQNKKWNKENCVMIPVSKDRDGNLLTYFKMRI